MAILLTDGNAKSSIVIEADILRFFQCMSREMNKDHHLFARKLTFENGSNE